MIDYSLLITAPVAACFALVIIYAYKLWLRMGKELVEIVDNAGIKKKGYYATEENKLVITKGKKGRGGHPSYKPKFDADCFLYYHEGWFIKTLKRKLMLMQGALQCIRFKGQAPDFGVMEGQGEVNDYFDVNVVKSAGNVRSKIEVPMILYLLIGATLVISGISLFILSKFA